jgi:uncharacterized membrane protein YhaH (DUF805 family)
MDYLALWFSFRGRVNRARFWLVLMSNMVLAFVGVFIIVSALGLKDPDLMLVAMAAWFVVLNVSTLAVAAKRLHDFDYRAWWLLGMLAVIGVIMVLTDQFPIIFRNQFYQVPSTIADNVIVWVVIAVLGAIPGTRGPNRFGPDPLAPRHASAV